MLVVSDTSPLTALLQIGQIELLRGIFGRVMIPGAVRDELLREHSTVPDWIEVLLPSMVPQEVLAAGLDRGETEAIALALEAHADSLLIDERLGRRVAVALGLRVTGMLGVLVLGKRKGVVKAVRPLIAELQTVAGCWFDGDLIDDVFRAAGE